MKGEECKRARGAVRHSSLAAASLAPTRSPWWPRPGLSMTDFAFSNLLGAPYRGGSLVLHGSLLLSPVGNRVTQARGYPPP